MSEQEKINTELTLADIGEFVKFYWLKGLILGVFSLIVISAVFILAYFYLPSSEFYNRDIMLQLQRTIPRNTQTTTPQFSTELFCYPNLEPFVNTDLISTPVLKAVYERNNLKSKVNFSDFSKAFAISDFNAECAKIEATYRKKLAAKNLSIADINDIEKNYREELAKIPSNRLTVSIEKLPGISAQEMTKIINEIPREWYRIYSETEAEVLPQMPSVQLLKKLDNRYGLLAALEKIRAYTNQFEDVIEEMNKLISSRNITIKSGKTLGDLLADIKNIRQFQLAVMKQILLGTPSLKSDLDMFYLREKEIETEHELDKIESQVSAIVSALEILSSKHTATDSKGAEKSSSGTTQIMLSSAFINDITSLIRNDVNNSVRLTLSQQMMHYKTLAADLRAEKNYLEKMRKNYTETTALKNNTANYNKLFAECLNELKNITSQINEFKKLITEEYSAERRFYVNLGTVKVDRNILIPPQKLAIGLIALWILLNCGCMFIAFVKKYNI